MPLDQTIDEIMGLPWRDNEDIRRHHATHIQPSYIPPTGPDTGGTRGVDFNPERQMREQQDELKRDIKRRSGFQTYHNRRRLMEGTINLNNPNIKSINDDGTITWNNREAMKRFQNQQAEQQTYIDHQNNCDSGNSNSCVAVGRQVGDNRNPFKNGDSYFGFRGQMPTTYTHQVEATSGVDDVEAGTGMIQPQDTNIDPDIIPTDEPSDLPPDMRPLEPPTLEPPADEPTDHTDSVDTSNQEDHPRHEPEHRDIYSGSGESSGKSSSASRGGTSDVQELNQHSTGINEYRANRRALQIYDSHTSVFSFRCK